MYLNVISFKNGKTLAFKSALPFSVDKLPQEATQVNEWIVVTDDENGQVLSFRGSEVVTIATTKVIAEPEKKAKSAKFKTGITKQ